MTYTERPTNAVSGAKRTLEAAGIDHRLLKPVDPDTLRSLLAGQRANGPT